VYKRQAWDGQSAAAAIPLPRLRGDGALERTKECGVVFVLVPGGLVTYGAQYTEPGRPFYDADSAWTDNLSLVDLDPFLIARHEMTRGQWSRLWPGIRRKRSPSSAPRAPDVGESEPEERLPVDSVSWMECLQLVRHYGLALPSEAQWEYACRSGTTGPFHVEEEDLPQFANMKQAGRDAGVLPVGALGCNDFGLYDMHGNVYEWCADYVAPDRPQELRTRVIRAGDGLRSSLGIDEESHRVIRGGCWNSGKSSSAKSSQVAFEDAFLRTTQLGLRAVRPIHDAGR